MKKQRKENKNVNSANAEKAQAAKQAAAFARENADSVSTIAAEQKEFPCTGSIDEQRVSRLTEKVVSEWAVAQQNSALGDSQKQNANGRMNYAKVLVFFRTGKKVDLRDKIFEALSVIFDARLNDELPDASFAQAWFMAAVRAISRGNLLPDKWYEENEFIARVSSASHKKAAKDLCENRQAELISWLEQNTLGFVESESYENEEKENVKHWRIFPAGSFFARRGVITVSLLALTFSVAIDAGKSADELAERFAGFDPAFFLNKNEAALAFQAWKAAANAQKTVKEQKK